MTESEYHHMLDELFIRIEEALDNLESVDIDYESGEGILTLILPDQSKIILNKQPPLLQLWVATKYNGHHFNYDNGKWIDERFGGEFFAFFDEAVSKQAGTEVSLNLQ
ncbi:iron donor protein CyaY [Glaciecola petra]|uniref:Iron-sulfur cluster assembly protein CyaY n=1 Tax=Glaciecola petra TaxID=3075602 RepID=A0ABU2ZY46_9ALTE|nr:iron donor protein CyaY [Aestuariibacter sp. P117]MDT0596332.1 iron donor protein CyaY [Aestuariibacter sp. P117]